MNWLKYIINDLSFITEANIVNGGKDEIIIKDNDGNEAEVIHSFDKIMDRYISREIVKSRTPPEVKKWFNSNFKKWIKRGAPDHKDDMMNEDVFRKTFYVPLDDYIKDLLRTEQDLVKAKKLSKEIILKSFPPFVQKNPKDAVVFSGGRLFRLKKITAAVEKLHDYLVTTVSERGNATLMPPQFAVKNLTTLQVPEAFKRSDAWHRYMEQQKEKVSKEKAKQLVKELKKGVDYKVLEKFESGNYVVQLLTAKAADVEGTILKHCVASYGRDIEKGLSVIYSVRDKEGIPVATIEMKGDNATQVKGPRNSTIKPEYHNDIRKFFKERKIKVSHDAKNFGGMKENERE